jgi:hypothetical protein
MPPLSMRTPMATEPLVPPPQELSAAPFHAAPAATKLLAPFPPPLLPPLDPSALMSPQQGAPTLP